MDKNRSKTRKEERSLRQVFSVNNFPHIKKCENPDFIIHAEGGYFGVEITEYYQDTETSGYYANDKQYMHNILDAETSIRKKDRYKLERVTIGFGIGDNPPLYWQNAVYKPYLPPEDRIKRLNQIINTKVISFEHYKRDLKFIDLIVHDQGDLFGGEGGKEVHRYLLELSKQPLIEMPFRKIYISKKFGAFEEPITFVSSRFNS